MQPKRPLPENRTLEQVYHHFQVEKALAARLRQATREERTEIYRTMYGELMSQVPDHPRAVRRVRDGLTASANNDKFKLLRPLLDSSTRFLEFAPGDCRFAMAVSAIVSSVCAVDISDQRGDTASERGNFRLVIYDGYELDLPGESIDVGFSDQLVEHFHPEDTLLHFQLVHNLLCGGGRYLFRTPHRYDGPHDVSKYFSDRAEGFHLKEWTYTELSRLIKDAGYGSWRGLWHARGVTLRLPNWYFLGVEKCVGILPKAVRRHVSRIALPKSS